MNKLVRYNNLDIYIANTFFSKFKGLMGKKNINYGLLLTNTNGIHTFFMKENIDVLLLDKNYKIVKTYKSVKPNRVILPKKSVVHTLELPNNYLEDKMIYK